MIRHISGRVTPRIDRPLRPLFRSSANGKAAVVWEAKRGGDFWDSRADQGLVATENGSYFTAHWPFGDPRVDGVWEIARYSLSDGQKREFYRSPVDSGQSFPHLRINDQREVEFCAVREVGQTPTSHGKLFLSDRIILDPFSMKANLVTPLDYPVGDQFHGLPVWSERGSLFGMESHSQMHSAFSIFCLDPLTGQRKWTRRSTEFRGNFAYQEHIADYGGHPGWYYTHFGLIPDTSYALLISSDAEHFHQTILDQEPHRGMHVLAQHTVKKSGGILDFLPFYIAPMKYKNGDVLLDRGVYNHQGTYLVSGSPPTVRGAVPISVRI